MAAVVKDALNPHFQNLHMREILDPSLDGGSDVKCFPPAILAVHVSRGELSVLGSIVHIAALRQNLENRHLPVDTYIGVAVPLNKSVQPELGVVYHLVHADAGDVEHQCVHARLPARKLTILSDWVDMF